VASQPATAKRELLAARILSG